MAQNVPDRRKGVNVMTGKKIRLLQDKAKKVSQKVHICNYTSMQLCDYASLYLITRISRGYTPLTSNRVLWFGSIKLKHLDIIWNPLGILYDHLRVIWDHIEIILDNLG